MTKIKFGTDGWRAIIAKDFTVDNVKRVAYATALWIKEHGNGNNSIVLGFDCRFAGRLFAETAAEVFVAEGLTVKMAPTFVSTPMISLAALKYKAALGIILTASHNPPSYNGYKVKAHFGGPAVPAVIAEIEALIPDQHTGATANFKEAVEQGKISFIDPETDYLQAVEEGFDLNAINNAGFGIAYDAMYGAGQSVIKKILPKAAYLHCDTNPGFQGQAPEPIHKNLLEFSAFLKENDDYHVGLANDGDADRIGMYNGKGEFIDSHHLILLLIYYLKEHKNYDGKVVIAFSVTDKVKKLCEQYGLEVEVTKVGFKYIAGKMIEEDVLLGGEESGGIAVKGHIPERDGIWMGLLIFELMAKTGKSMDELIETIYEKVGSFFYKRNDLHITEEAKLGALEKCKAGIKSFGDLKVLKEETVDGFKYHFENEQWLMIRASGTEPVLRVYAESADEAGADKILKIAEETLVG